MRRVLALVAILVLLASGCTRQTGREFKQIVYTYRGGIAGFDRSITIDAGGAYQVTEKGQPNRNGRLSSAELKSVRQLSAAVNWSGVAEKYVDPRIADAIMEGVTVVQGTNTYKTVVGTGAQPPAELSQFLGKLKQIMDTYKT